MKYYILGKRVKQGTVQSDAGDQNQYTQLGFQLMLMHLHAKHLYKIGQIKQEDVIVSLKDRIFLYTKVFKNVIPYEQFVKLNVSEENIVDLVKDHSKIYKDYGYFDYKTTVNKKYKYFYDQHDQITNLDYVSMNKYYQEIKNKFICVHVRLRQWAFSRNTPEDFTSNLIKSINDLRLNCFIFGKGAERYANNININYVNLQQSASLLNNKNCAAFIGCLSGGSMISQFRAHPKCKVYILKTQSIVQGDIYNPMHHNQIVNFTGSETIFIDSGFNISNVLKDIKENRI